MRVMAYLGGADVPRRRPRRLAVLAAEARAGALVPPDRRSSRSRFRTSPRCAGWVLTEMGRQPWIVQGLLKTADAHLADGRRDHVGFSLGVFVGLYLAARRRRHRADAPLRHARPARGRPRRGRRELPHAGDRTTEMDLQDALVLPGRLLLGRLLRARGLRLRRRHTAAVPAAQRGRARHDVRTIGPVWDGNEVWLVVAGGATFAAFPAWYATMFSGFYVALLLLLVFLIVRVRLVRVARAGRRARAGAASGLGEHDRQPRRALDLGCRALEPPLRRADQLRRRLRRHLLGSLQPLHGARRGRGRAPVRVPRRDLPHAAHHRRAVQRAAPRPRRLSRCRPSSSARAS